jgi:transposase
MTKSKRAQMYDEHGNLIDNKTGIMGFLSRHGQVITEVMHHGKTFKERVRDNVSKDATLITDGHSGYEGLDIEFFKHEVINHLIGEYKRGEWHNNNIEGFWSQLKRTIKGTHIHCDAKYLQIYADEVAFRYMNRERQDEMFNIILSHVA